MAEEISDEMKKDIMEFQGLQQQAQYNAMQKQQTMLQIADLEKALEELKTASGQCYRYAGTVIIPKDKAAIEKELADEKESLELRQGILQKQEAAIKERASSLTQKFQGETAGAQQPKRKVSA